MKRILVIEDEYHIRLNVKQILEFSDYEVIAAEDGDEGLRLAMQRQPDLIVSDIQMPKMDGYQLLEAVRAYPLTQFTPVIFLTARADRLDQRRAMELGADDYVSKPFTAEELVSAIEARLSKQEASLQHQREQMEAFCGQLSRTLPHEFYTPLNGISTSADVLLFAYDKLTKQEAIELLEVIQSSGKRLHRLIQNFLLYAELELKLGSLYANPLFTSGSTKSDPLDSLLIGIATDLSILQSIAETIAQQYQRLPDLHIDLPSLQVKVPDSQFRKIFLELIDNAFKFSQPGQCVDLQARLDRDFVMIQVQDQGRGMTAQQLNQLGGYIQFERKLYEQQGCGLGLTIAQRMIELFGGGISLYSVPGSGTTLQVSLPFAE